MERETEFRTDKAINALYSESTGEYVLPDYKGDVKKILLTRAYAVPGGKFPCADSVEYVGVICYNVVYVDAENNISGAEFTTDYQITAKCNEDTYIDSLCHTRVANFNLRLMGPRKFSVKANMESSIHISEGQILTIEGDAFDGRTPECSTKQIMVRCADFGNVKEREYGEEIARIDGAVEDEIEVLICNVEPQIASATAHEGEAQVKGELRVTAVISRGEEMPYTEHLTIPFDESVPSEALVGNEHISAHVYITSVKTSVNPTEDGVAITLSIIAETEIFALRGDEVTVCLDAYLEDNETVNEYKDFAYSELIGASEVQDNFSAELSKGECAAENVRNVIFSVANAVIDSTDISDTMVMVGGKIRFNGIACEVNEDGVIGYSPVKLDVPFRQNVNIGCQIPEGCRVECTVEPILSSIDADAEKLYPSCTLCTGVSVSASRTERCVSASVVTGAEIKREPSVVTVYYPEPSDTLFDIAKRYHTTVMNIAVDNSLSEAVFMSQNSPSSLNGIKKLIIK